MSENFWKRYNKSIERLVQRISKHNDHNSFNYIEEGFYPHVRDLAALTIVQTQYENINKNIKILDFGSNEASVINLRNKIDTKSIQYFIYDPYSEIDDKSSNIDFLNCQIIRNENMLYDLSYELIIFGSSIQYIENIFDIFREKYVLNASKILFTHTPLSLGKQKKLKQHSSYTGYQFLYSFEEIKAYFCNNDFNLIFKSTLNPKYSAIENKYLDEVVYANLLFART